MKGECSPIISEILQVRTSAEPISGDKSPLLSDVSRSSSPKPPIPNTMAVPSPSAANQKITKSTRKAAWGKFIRKTSEQMLGIPAANNKVK